MKGIHYSPELVYDSGCKSLGEERTDFFGSWHYRWLCVKELRKYLILPRDLTPYRFWVAMSRDRLRHKQAHRVRLMRGRRGSTDLLVGRRQIFIEAPLRYLIEHYQNYYGEPIYGWIEYQRK